MFKRLAKPVLHSIGVEVKRYRPELEQPHVRAFALLGQARDLLPQAAGFVWFCAGHITQTRGELFQDLLALYLLNEKREGYFVDIGATNGLDSNNTYLLEHSYGWSGIVAEPARCWRKELLENRQCSIDGRCVWSRTGQTVTFLETDTPQYSTVNAFRAADFHAHRRSGKTYPVKTVSLMDLLAEHNAPPIIDYLSIDTEGTELEILRPFDFSLYQIRVITVEHNHAPHRQGLHDLLTSCGFRRIFEELSGFDDWYVSTS